jgi:hypothetical protein
MMFRRTRRAVLGAALLVPLAGAGCAEFGAPGRPEAAAATPGGPGAAGAGVGQAAARPAAPPTPTAAPTPEPTPIPEPWDYAIEGGWYYAQPGFSVRDESGGPRFWSEFGRQGGVEGLGPPASRVYDATVDGAPARAQRFRDGWLAGAPGGAAVRRGEGAAPVAPAEALAREGRPEMALIGRVDVDPRRARQGQTVLLRIWSQTAPAASVTVENRTIELVRDGDALIGLFGVSRQGRLGPRPVRVTVADAAGRRTVRSDPADTIEVVDGGFAREQLVMDGKALSLLDPVRQAQENATLDGVQGRWTPEQRWRGPWTEPVGPGEPPAPLSSGFGLLRSINGGPYSWSHEGTDFLVGAGEPVKAVAGGRVALAQELYVRGNTVVVDHGLGLFSMYNHLSQFDVQPGQDVEPGQVIGLVGATGFVTGPHLHLELRLHNQPVEPLEWLGRPPFERPDLAAL